MIVKRIILIFITLSSIVMCQSLRGTDNNNNNYKESFQRKLSSNNGWVQRGGDLYGETHFARASNVAVSKSGDVVAVGAPGNNNGGGYNGGHVRVYEWSGSTWEKRGDDIDSENVDELYGEAVSLNGDGTVIAIGATGVGTGYYSGETRIFQWSGSTWQQMGSGLAGNAYDFFGTAVSLSDSGMTIAIGANGVNYYDGVVRVFDWNGSAWIQRGTDLISGSSNLEFGSAVSINGNGNILAVGIPSSNINGTNSGEVCIFKWDGTSWTLMGSTIPGLSPFDGFGEKVSLSTDGLTVAMGAPGYDGAGTSLGLCRVFQWNGSDWSSVGSDIEGEFNADNAGESVAISGDGLTVAVGAPRHDGTGSDHGQVRIFKFDGSDWLLSFDITGVNIGDELGFHVALNEDGTVVAVGAPKHDDNSLDNNGHALVFDLVDQTPTAVPTVAPTELVLQSAVIETPHPYPANMNSAWEVEFPDVTCYDLTMHPKSYTPHDSDYVKLFTISYNEGTKILTQIGSEALPPYRAMRLYKNRLHDFGTQQINAAGIRVEFVSDDAGSNYGLHLTVTECSP